jgi:hypothetical protein
MKRHFLYLLAGLSIFCSCQENLLPESVYLDANAKAKLASRVQKDPLLDQYAEATFKSQKLMREGSKAPGFNIEEYAAQTRKLQEMGDKGQLGGQSFGDMMTKALTVSGFGNVEAYVTSLDKERLLHKQLVAKYPGLNQYDGDEWVSLIRPAMERVYKSNGLSWYPKPKNTSL